jgi:hypothetical protein
VPQPGQHSAPPAGQRSASPYPDQRIASPERRDRTYRPPKLFNEAAPSGAPAPPPARAPSYADGKPQANRAAVAALVFGIIGGSLFAIVLGFVGRARAKTAGRGRAMATVGLMLGVIWLVVEGGVIAVETQSRLATVVKQYVMPTPAPMDQGCAAVEGSGAAATMEADAKAGDVTKLVTDFHTMAAEMTAAQAKTTRPVAAAAMKQFATDLTTYSASLSKGQSFSQAEVNKFVADAGAVDKACAP